MLVADGSLEYNREIICPNAASKKMQLERRPVIYERLDSQSETQNQARIPCATGGCLDNTRGMQAGFPFLVVITTI